MVCPLENPISKVSDSTQGPFDALVQILPVAPIQEQQFACLVCMCPNIKYVRSGAMWLTNRCRISQDLNKARMCTKRDRGEYIYIYISCSSSGRERKDSSKTSTLRCFLNSAGPNIAVSEIQKDLLQSVCRLHCL